MSIKSIVGFFEDIKSRDISEAFNPSKENQQQAVEAFKEMEKNTGVAQEEILSRITEEEFVKFMLMVQKMTIVSAVSEGKPELAMVRDSSLQSYTHSVVLAVIGALIEEEIL